MTNPNDLCEQLDAIGEEEMYQAPATTKATIDEAAAFIRQLRLENEELRDALEQFVNGVDTHMIDSPADDILANVTARAKAALSQGERG